MTKYELKEGKILKIEEYETTKDIASFIRELIKKKYDLSPKDVSVKKRDVYAVNIVIKSFKALKYKNELEKIAEGKEKIDRDMRTGEILSGGNTFVFVTIDFSFQKDAEKIVEKEIKKVASKDFLDIKSTEGSNLIKIFDEIEVMKVEMRGNVEGYSVITKDRTLGNQPTKYIESIYASVFDEILDRKNAEKIFNKYFK